MAAGFGGFDFMKTDENNRQIMQIAWSFQKFLCHLAKFQILFLEVQKPSF